jgi:hypothetical protein
LKRLAEVYKEKPKEKEKENENDSGRKRVLAKTWALDAKIHGTMLPATSAPRRQGLGASDHGAMPLYLDANDYGAKIRVHFLKSFHKGHI